jgi:arginyl-tRNA synthetase
MKEALISLLEQSLSALEANGTLPQAPGVTPQVDHTRDASHGDLATNLAMVLAKRAGMAPRALAEAIVSGIPENTLIARAEIAGPGFINFFLNQASQVEIIGKVLASGPAFGTSRAGAGRKVQVEFVSANPTGPLHVGHGRGAAIGDSLCRLLTATGWDVQREFYYNDAGQQINNLALSVQARARGLGPDDETWPTDGYRGTYIIDLATAYVAGATVAAADRSITALGVRSGRVAHGLGSESAARWPCSAH